MSREPTMDYSYFTTAPPSYQIFQMPPTPQSHTPQADEYGNISPYDNAYSNYDASYGHYHPPATTIVTTNSISPPKSTHRTSIDEGNTNGIQAYMGDMTGEENQRTRSSSEEKDNMTPAQSRRKAQNRAAQRAFRERKERHVKDLEQKLTTLEQTSSNFAAENERLKREIAKISTENEILRATSGSNPPSSVLPRHHSPSPPITTGPQMYTPTDLYTSVLDPASGKVTQAKRSPNHRIVVSEKTGERLLGAGATWDMIQAHELYKRGLVDVGDVCERLKNCAKCDGQGPVFEEGDVKRIIAESVAGGSDELI